jgi:hypothetical protein
MDTPTILLALATVGIPALTEAAVATCLYQKLNSTIMVVKATDDRLRCDAANRR